MGKSCQKTVSPTEATNGWLVNRRGINATVDDHLAKNLEVPFAQSLTKTMDVQHRREQGSSIDPRSVDRGVICGHCKFGQDAVDLSNNEYLDNYYVVAVEFDTLQKRGNGKSFNNLTLASGQQMQVWVEYDYADKHMNVTMAPMHIAKPNRPLLSLVYDLSSVTDENVSIGFSASGLVYLHEEWEYVVKKMKEY
ncbi:putative L-type lectin-domain containing receptor kinase V.2 [Solanum lycopersicum]|uniref:putative L-type lectin-domain containing receptor kinase V.2 n=1 Tax=Solanum lycopersicum TaxID=4081 RepID=UPI00374788BF